MQTPAPFEYERATSVDDALALLERHGPEARLVAGGHSLLPMMKLRLARPEVLVDINDLTDLSYIRLDGDAIAIGAMTRHAELLDSPLLGEHYAVFPDAERVIADPVVRNRGTIGGSLCQADPSEDLAAVASALRAEIVVRSSEGTRAVAARELHDGPYETVVGPAEILTEVRVPIRPGGGQRLREGRAAGRRLGGRRGRRLRTLDGDTVSDVGIGLTALGAPHFCAPEAEDALRGQPATEENLATAAAAARRGVQPVRRPAGARRLQAPPGRELTLRALRRAVARAQRRRRLTMQVTMTVNGEEVTRDIEPRLLLVHFVRDHLGLTGTHWGCDTSNCGTCVLWMDGEPVKSCTVLAAMAGGRTSAPSRTSSSDGELDPVQQGFMQCHGLQCGFCTPGMLMTGRWLLDHDPDPSEATIREAISGQFCRCTGYENIVRAIRWAAEHPDGPARPAPRSCRRDHDRRHTVPHRVRHDRSTEVAATRPLSEAGNPIGFGRMLRKEDARFLRGKGNYIDDIQLPGMLHGAILRSPYAHARIVLHRHVGGRGASQGQGGHHRRHPGGPDLAWMPTLSQDVQAVLATDKVRFQGQEVAFVVAEDRYAARDALELIEVDYEPLDPVVDARRALDEGAPVIRDDIEGKADNHIFDWESGDAARCDEVFAGPTSS